MFILPEYGEKYHHDLQIPRSRPVDIEQQPLSLMQYVKDIEGMPQGIEHIKDAIRRSLEGQRYNLGEKASMFYYVKLEQYVLLVSNLPDQIRVFKAFNHDEFMIFSAMFTDYNCLDGVH